MDERYNEQDRREVAAALATSAAGLVTALPSPADTAWDRAGTRREREFNTPVPHWFRAAGDRGVEILSRLGTHGECAHVRAAPRRKRNNR